jgi:hypothetical protein
MVEAQRSTTDAVKREIAPAGKANIIQPKT